MRTQSANVFLVAVFLGAASACFAMVAISDRGAWPTSWPKELECYRGQSKTFEVMHGIHEDVHEIRFRDRADFKQAWPYLLQLKTPGAPVILEPSPSTYGVSGSTAEAGVRILCPPRCFGGVSGDKESDFSQDLPDFIKTLSGKRPEYIVRKDGKWIAYDGANRVGFIHRARIDLMLIADGTIIDLDFMALPANTPIIDNRLKQGPRYSAFVTCYNEQVDSMS